MEASGAREIFLRSIDSRSLKYTTLIGDGDTGTFGKVRDDCLRIYGPSYTVVKVGCIPATEQTPTPKPLLEKVEQCKVQIVFVDDTTSPILKSYNTAEEYDIDMVVQ